MSDSDGRHNCPGIVVRILSTVVLFTVAMTFVWVRSSLTTAKGSVHHTTGDGPVALDHGLMLVSNATLHVAREPERVWNATPEAIQEPAGEGAARHRLRANYPSVTTRSHNDGVVFQDNRFETGSSLSKNRLHSSYHLRDNTSTQNLNNDTDTSQVLHEMNIRLNHRQINNYGYPTIQIDETVADTDVLNNNQNAYDLTYDVNNEKGSEKNKNSIYRSGWTTFFNRSRQIIPGGLRLFETPEISGNYDQPPFRLGARYQNKKDIEYRFKQYGENSNPTYKIDFKNQPILDTQQDSLNLQSTEGIPAIQNNKSSSLQPTMLEGPIINEILWRRIGLMALIKLGLVKLKVIGFIKILYFLLFKLKFVLIVLFFKFVSLLKFIKLSSLPLLFMPLAAIIFLVAMKTFPAYSSLILDINNNPGNFSTANTPIPNNDGVINSPDGTIKFTEEIVSIPGETSSLVPTGQTVLVPTGQTVVVPSNQVETVVVPSGQSPTVVVSPAQNPSSNIPPDVIQAFNNLPGLRYEPLDVMDPTLDLFQMELNSEKCVERIACKIAATGKTGIIPLWINWVLHRVSKPVPTDKLLYYLKIYDDVTNEIHMKSPNPDDWETWCFERYDCNNTDTK